MQKHNVDDDNIRAFLIKRLREENHLKSDQQFTVPRIWFREGHKEEYLGRCDQLKRWLTTNQPRLQRTNRSS